MEQKLAGTALTDLLDDVEKEFYESRKQQYMSEFDLNKSSDFAVLEQVLIEEVLLNRLYHRALSNPKKSFDNQIKSCQERLLKSLESLNMMRKQRMMGEQKTPSVTIAFIAQKFVKDRDRRLQLIQEEEQEELMFIQEKRLRDIGNVMEVIDVAPVSAEQDSNSDNDTTT